MNIEEMEARLETLKGAVRRGEHDVAHGHDDDIRRDVLRHIASGECSLEHAKTLAAMALQTEDWDFARWCA